MSFLFNWLDLSVLDLKSSLNAVLSSTTIPQLPQKVSISSLSFGEKPPRFEILDIIDLKENKFKGLFKFNYDGGLNVAFNTDYEANAIRLIDFDPFTKPNFVLTDKSTVLPVEFKIKNIKIDAILTVVFNGRVTVVFNDDPFIDLDIETSLDEFLDEDLFDMIKQDTLNLITEMLKQDLPEMLHSMTLDQAITTDTELESLLEHEVLDSSLKRSISALSIYEHPTSIKLQENLFDTMSLKPQGFTDVIQRVSLSKIDYQNMASQPRHRSEERKRRRVIKMNKKSTKKIQKQEEAMVQSKESSSVEASIIEEEVLPEEEVSYARTSQSGTSSTTLIDITYGTNSTSSLDDYLNSETLVLNEADKLDPYESLTHPMDLLPSYKKDPNSLKIIAKNSLRPRGPSSNYINLNNDFKDFMTQKHEQRSLVSEDLVDEEVFYDLE